MRVKEIMTSNPTCCTPETSLKDVAKMMLDHDCGEIPVVDDKRKPMGVITDRDIVCRAVAKGKDPSRTFVKDCMTKPCITIHPEKTVEDCCKILEENQIRRIPVVDEKGSCCGMVSQADIATHHLKDEIVEVLEVVSQPHRA